MFEKGYLPAGEIIELVESEKLNKFIGWHLMAFGRVLDGGRIIVVSKHLNRKDVERMNLSYSGTLEEALAVALKDNGKTKGRTVLKQACKIVPKKYNRTMYDY